MNSKTFLFVTGISAGIAAFYLQNNEQLVQSFIFGGNFGPNSAKIVYKSLTTKILLKFLPNLTIKNLPILLQKIRRK